jgi:hypothetical protein
MSLLFLKGRVLCAGRLFAGFCTESRYVRHRIKTLPKQQPASTLPHLTFATEKQNWTNQLPGAKPNLKKR